MTDEFFEVVVIGSGFGGAVTAYRAAKAGRKVLVLERGKLYRPGDFPRSPLEMSTNFWDPREDLFGLFQIWSFSDLDAVVASGVGGGSLIYANVMLPMPRTWFEASAAYWPMDYSDIADHYQTVEEMMGVKPFPPNMRQRVPKVPVFEDAAKTAGMDPRPAPLAVTFATNGQQPGDIFGPSEHGLHQLQRRTCRLCGECDLGCNDGAKNTLDFTYLAQAKRHGAVIRPLHEVKRITAMGHGNDHEYELGYVVHQPIHPPWERGRRTPDERPELQLVRAKVVVVAAGALGSTWLLLANRTGLPYLSGQLGTRFSCNGDALGFLTKGRDIAESPRGPVITEYARHDDRPYYIEDGGYPAVLGWLGESLSPALYARAGRILLSRWWERRHGRANNSVSAKVAAALGSAQVSRSTLPLLAMGMDPSLGTMRLADGLLELDWSTEWSREYLHDIWKTMMRMGRASDSRFREVFSSWLSRNITAHPLGGCPMGKDAAHGVVNDHGEAFGHRGLFVTDGSVLPGPVGANPSLTIAALAERFAKRIVERSR
jgi:cholesterol oxidase